MSEAELTWLNDYHARVYDQLAPLVPDAEAEWLGKVTEPL